jgi:hypothetical protein
MIEQTLKEFVAMASGALATATYSVTRGAKPMACETFVCRTHDGERELTRMVDEINNREHWGLGAMRPTVKLVFRRKQTSPNVTFGHVLVATHGIYFELWAVALGLPFPQRQAMMGTLLGFGVTQIKSFIHDMTIPWDEARNTGEVIWQAHNVPAPPAGEIW